MAEGPVIRAGQRLATDNAASVIQDFLVVSFQQLNQTDGTLFRDFCGPQINLFCFTMTVNWVSLQVVDKTRHWITDPHFFLILCRPNNQSNNKDNNWDESTSTITVSCSPIVYIDEVMWFRQQFCLIGHCMRCHSLIQPLPCYTYFESLWICTISLRLNGLPVSKLELDSTDTRLLKGSHMLWASR